MPFLSGTALAGPALVLVFGWLLWRGGVKGRCFVILLSLSLLAGDGLVINPLKKSVNRPRPYSDIPETRLLVGQGSSRSMPSSHMASWACAAVVTALFYRRSRRWMWPLAGAIGLSRISVGVHYPSDVLVGLLLGCGYGWLVPRVLNRLWQRLGPRWFSNWHRQLPSFLPDADGQMPVGAKELPSLVNAARQARQWLILGYSLIGALLCARLIYLRSHVIQLSEDEAYQWLWSKHPALSYYSKPPFIAYAQWIGTHLFGDTELGVRFFAPVIAALVGVLLLRFVARHLQDQRAAFLLVAGLAAVPLLAVGSIIMTIDPLTVLFWTLAMLTGWQAITEGRTRDWLLVGVWLGGGFLSKFISPLQWLSFLLFFALWPSARAQLRRPGPWLAVLINLLAVIPVLLWNRQHGWVTATHLSERGGLEQSWKPTLRFFNDFVVAEFGLLNPFVVIAFLVAVVVFWRRQWPRRAASTEATGLRLYLFCHGIVVLGFYLLYTFRARVHPNWIATSLVPLLLFTFFVAHDCWRAGARWPKRLFTGALLLGLPLVILLHDTNLVTKLTHHALPAKADPSLRVRGYADMAKLVAEQRTKLLAEGKPVFVIADHYGRCGLLNFYWPEAKARVTTDPLVTVVSSDVPKNQIWFWPHYRYDRRQGDNALFVLEAKPGVTLPDRVRGEFASVTDLGVFEIAYRGRVAHRVQLFACRDKR